MIDPVTRWVLSACAGLAILAVVWLHGHHKGGEASDQRHAATFLKIERLTAAAAEKAHAARQAYSDAALVDLATFEKEKENAFEAGRRAAAGINDGSVRVRTVWRERECPKAVPGPGAEPAGRDLALPEGRGDAIGRVLGYGWRWNAEYGLAYAGLIRAQKLVDACYEQPAEAP